MSAREAQVLHRAVEILDERGWCQGTFEDGRKVCAMGAINIAVGGSPFPGNLEPGDERIATEVAELVEGVVDEDVTTWNDVFGRTVEQVRQALLTAAIAAELGEAVA